MNEFKHFSQWIPKALQRYHVDREARAALICERFRKLAPEVIGKEALKHIRPKNFKRGILTIAVQNSLWAQQVYVHRHDLLMKLNLNLEKEWVQDLRTEVGLSEAKEEEEDGFLA